MTYLEEYYEKIKTNEIIAGYYLETEIENLIEDLQDERYIYDTLEAHKRIKLKRALFKARLLSIINP